MDGYERIVDLVARGYVLDENGTWVPIAEKVAAEREFRRHLERGEVLCGERWTDIRDVH